MTRFLMGTILTIIVLIALAVVFVSSRKYHIIHFPFHASLEGKTKAEKITIYQEDISSYRKQIKDIEVEISADEELIKKLQQEPNSPEKEQKLNAYRQDIHDYRDQINDLENEINLEEKLIKDLESNKPSANAPSPDGTADAKAHR